MISALEQECRLKDGPQHNTSRRCLCARPRGQPKSSRVEPALRLAAAAFAIQTKANHRVEETGTWKIDSAGTWRVQESAGWLFVQSSNHLHHHPHLPEQHCSPSTTLLILSQTHIHSPPGFGCAFWSVHHSLCFTAADDLLASFRSSKGRLLDFLVYQFHGQEEHNTVAAMSVGRGGTIATATFSILRQQRFAILRDAPFRPEFLVQAGTSSIGYTDLQTSCYVIRHFDPPSDPACYPITRQQLPSFS